MFTEEDLIDSTIHNSRFDIILNDNFGLPVLYYKDVHEITIIFDNKVEGVRQAYSDTLTINKDIKKSIINFVNETLLINKKRILEIIFS